MKILDGLLLVTASASIALTVGNAPADQSRGESSLVRFSSINLGDLEDAFWRCDYQATTQGGGGNQITLCVEVYEMLKQRKFGGDFDLLLVWWQSNKAVRHATLAAVDAKENRRIIKPVSETP